MKKLKIGIIGIGRLGYEHACNIANRVPGSELVAISDQNIARAKEVAEEFGKYLGTALATIACVTDPEVFVIGGGVSKAGQVILDYIKKYYVQYAFMTCKQAGFALAKLGNDAGIYGAAKMLL